MDVFDSNVWIWALTRECDPAVDLVDSVINEDRWVAVSPYIFEEVMQNLSSADQPPETIERCQTRFAEIVHGSTHVDEPDPEDVRNCDLEAVQEMHAYQTIAAGSGIQVKDAPILSFAHNWSEQPHTRRPGDDPVTIYTADYSFSQFNASDLYDNLQMRHVDC